MEEFGADYVTITDEDGTSYEMEILSRFEHEGCEYMALIPADTQDDEPNLEVISFGSLRMAERKFWKPFKTKTSFKLFTTS